ncbi:MAG: dihydrofolate reductase family protein, partial [Planctomycetota bacterium]|nr:dihydrofolate reductase family protein [Planctomycetota bacterium]
RADPGRTVLATLDGRSAELEARFAGLAEIWECGRDRVDLGAVLERLRADGVERLLLEGGGELNWAMLDAGLVDELHLTLAPALLGGREAPTLLEGDGWPMAAQRRLVLSHCERAGDELHLTYEIAR